MQILCVKTGPAKSLFHALPTVHRIKRAYQAQIDWVVHEEHHDVAACFDDVQRVICMPEDELKHKNRQRFRKELHMRTYDMVIDLEGSMQSALIAKSARKKRRAPVLGPSFQREGACLLYTAVTGTLDRSLHPVEACMDLLRYLEIPTSPVAYPLRFPFPFTQYEKKESYWVCALHARRRDQLESFFWQELIDRIGSPVVLIGDQKALDRADEIEQHVHEPVVNLCGRLNTAEQAGLVQAAAGVFCMDEWIMQLANAVSTPQIALFASGKAPQVLPYIGDYTLLLGSEVCVAAVEDKWRSYNAYEGAVVGI